MDELFLYSKKLVKHKIKSEMSSDIEDLLAIAVFGILLYSPEIEKNKLFKALDKLSIYESKDKYNLIKKRLHTHYIYDENVKNFGTTVISSYSINSIKEDEITFLDDKKALFILNDPNINTTKLVSNIIHSLLHLLRFDGFILNNNKIIRKDGLCYSTYDLKNNLVSKQNYNIEEGIIEKYVGEIMVLLKDTFLNVYSIENSILQKFKRELSSYDFISYNYDIQKDIVNALCLNYTFNEILNSSFNETCIPSKVESYFDNVMSGNQSFYELSKELDVLFTNSPEIIKMNSKSKIFHAIKDFLSFKKMK